MKRKRIEVGHLIVYERRNGCSITEPLSDCCVARGFPTLMHAIRAAREMNEVADWVGILKTRAQGGRPNCQDELQCIAHSYGGTCHTGNAGAATVEACARAVANL